MADLTPQDRAALEAHLKANPDDAEVRALLGHGTIATKESPTLAPPNTSKWHAGWEALKASQAGLPMGPVLDAAEGLVQTAKSAPSTGATIGAVGGGLAGGAVGWPRTGSIVGSGLGAAAGKAVENYRADKPNTAKDLTAEGMRAAGVSALTLGGMGVAGRAFGLSSAPWAQELSAALRATSPASIQTRKGTGLEGATPSTIQAIGAASAGGRAAPQAAQAVAEDLAAKGRLAQQALRGQQNAAALQDELSQTAEPLRQASQRLATATDDAIAEGLLQGGQNPIFAAVAKTRGPDAAKEMALAQAGIPARQAAFDNATGNILTTANPAVRAAHGELTPLAQSNAALGAAKSDALRDAARAIGVVDPARASELSTQSRVARDFSAPYFRGGIERDAHGNELAAVASMAGSNWRHTVANMLPWHSYKPAVTPAAAATAGRALETESLNRGLPAIDPTTRAWMTNDYGGIAPAATVEALRDFLYRDRK